MLMGILGCSNSLDVNTFIRWNKENKIIQEVSLDKIKLSVQYLPNDLMALNDLGTEINEIQRDSALRLIDEYGDGCYFALAFSSLDGQTPPLKVDAASMEEYYTRLQYLTAQVQEDIHLVLNQDTIDVAHHIFERKYGIGPTDKVLFHFPRNIQNTDQASILYRGLFSPKEMTFTFNTEQIKNIPNLEI